VLTPARPGVEPGSAKDGIQTRLKGRVRLDVVCPRGDGLVCGAYRVRGGARVRRDEGVNLVFFF